MRKLLLIVFMSAAFAQASAAQAAQTYDIFYLAVGNTDYLDIIPPGSETGPVKLQSFADLDDGARSAREMASYLDGAGAVYGMTLVSENGKLVVREDVLNALDKLLVKVKESKSPNPLVVFYFCGHGISEGIGWNHFSIPGGFILSSDDAKKMSENAIEVMAKNAIHAGDISDKIEKVTSSYMLLLDSCYEGKERSAASPFLTRQVEQNLNDSFKILRVLNEFRGPGIAIFATLPGSYVEMVNDPKNAEIMLGRIARRTILILDQARKTKNKLPVGEFLRKISDQKFDRETNSVLTRSVPGKPNTNLIKGFKAIRAPRNVIFGSGSPDDLPVKKPEDSLGAVPARKTIQGSPECYLSYESPSGEFIGQGETATISAKNYKFAAEEVTQSEVTFSITGEEKSMEITFAAPEGKQLTAGSHKNAQRAPFQEAGNPGFSFSVESRGCNKISGEFVINEIIFDTKGNLVKFSADFIQFCDDAASALKGSLLFSSAKI